MAEVSLNVYDVTKNVNGQTNYAIVTLNKVLRDGIRVGGVFHGAIEVSDEVYEQEWSFGFRAGSGTGVYRCRPRENPSYTFRETVSLGQTTCSRSDVWQIVTELREEWRGNTYNQLSRNCNHFCEVFATRLGVEKPPGWLNCFPLWLNSFAKAGHAVAEVAGLTVEKLKQAKAKTGEAAVTVAGLTVEKLKQAKAGVTIAGRKAHRYLFGDRPASPGAGSDAVSQGSPSVSGRSSFDYQGEML